jgi:hypothetical protein
MEWIQTLSKSLVAPIGKIMASKIKMRTQHLFKSKQGVKALYHCYLSFRNYYWVICKITLSSPSLWASFPPPPYPLFQWYPESKDIFIKSQYEMLQLSTKCWNSAFNAGGSRLIIVVVQSGAVKIYVAAVEALRKKERQDENT